MWWLAQRTATWGPAQEGDVMVSVITRHFTTLSGPGKWEQSS